MSEREQIVAAAEREFEIYERELSDLRRWKREALEVLAGWDLVSDALGNPGTIGQSMSAACVEAIERLKDRAGPTELEAAHELARAMAQEPIVLPEWLARIQNCTGFNAAWCPQHGDCTCEDQEHRQDLHNQGTACPLHREGSTHG